MYHYVSGMMHNGHVLNLSNYFKLTGLFRLQV